MNEKTIATAAALVAKALTDEGKLVEAGFEIFRHLTIAKDAPPIQVEEMRYAFMAGAQHLFGSIMGILDDGSEPTDMDLQRIELINKELTMWHDKLAQRYAPTAGEA